MQSPSNNDKGHRKGPISTRSRCIGTEKTILRLTANLVAMWCFRLSVGTYLVRLSHALWAKVARALVSRLKQWSVLFQPKCSKAGYLSVLWLGALGLPFHLLQPDSIE